MRVGVDLWAAVTIMLCACAASGPNPEAANTLGHFQGSFDVASETLTIAFGGERADESQSAIVLPYGTAANQVYFHTVPMTVAWNAPNLAGQVQFVNGYAGSVAGATAIVDSITPSGITFNGPISYGTIAGGATSAAQTWQFSDPAGVNFTFTGHAEGTLMGASFTVGGSVSGLVGSGLVLRVNGDPTNSVTLNGPASAFTFPKPIASGAAYAVSVVTQPGTYVQSCTASNASGTMGGANVTDVQITCGSVTRIVLTSNAFTVGGTPQGSPATIPDGTSSDCGTDVPSAALVGSITIASAHFTIGTARITLNSLNHTWLGDLRARAQLTQSSLVATTPLFDRVGRNTASPTCGSSSTVSGSYEFNDGAATTLWTSTTAGSYRPSTTNGTTTFLSTTAPNGFKGQTTNGTWTVSITDSGLGDTGTITSWTLDLRP